MSGFIITNVYSNGDFIDNFWKYVAKRIFRVESIDNIGSSFDEISLAGSSGRVEYIWPEAISRFLSSSFLGSGFNQDFNMLGGFVIPIHNMYLDILVGVGMFGSLPVLLVFFWWFRTIWKSIYFSENTLLLVSSLSYVISFCAIGFGDLLRYYHTPMMFFGLILGISLKVALLPQNQDTAKTMHT